MTKSQDREGLEVYHGATRNGASVQLDEAGSWRDRLAREAADALGDVDFWVVRLGGGASEWQYDDSAGRGWGGASVVCMCMGGGGLQAVN